LSGALHPRSIGLALTTDGEWENFPEPGPTQNWAIFKKILIEIKILCVNYVTHGKHNIEMKSQ